MISAVTGEGRIGWCDAIIDDGRLWTGIVMEECGAVCRWPSSVIREVSVDNDTAFQEEGLKICDPYVVNILRFGMVRSVSDCWIMAILPLPLENQRSLVVVRSLEDLRSLVAHESHQLALAGGTDPMSHPLSLGKVTIRRVPKSSRRLHSAVRPREIGRAHV
jgi:hypothetical protein